MIVDLRSRHYGRREWEFRIAQQRGLAEASGVVTYYEFEVCRQLVSYQIKRTAIATVQFKKKAPVP